MEDQVIGRLITAEIERQQTGLEDSSPAKTTFHQTCSRRWVACLPTNTLKATLADGTMAGSITPIKLSSWRLTVPSNYSALIMPMSSRTLAPKPTRQYIMHGASQATPFWRWTWRTAAT